MIRVLQTGMTDNLGGIENFLINYYRNIDKEKVQFDFVNIYDNKLCFQQEIEDLGGKVYDVPNYYKHPIKYIKIVKKIIKDNNYRIVHCNMNSAVMIFPLVAAKFAKAKVIIAHSHNSSSDKGFIKSALHWINKHWIPLFANNFWACSKVAGEWFYSKKIINGEKFKVINNAVDIEKFMFDKDIRIKKRKELNFKQDEMIIGNVGRFSKQKNQVFLVKILNEILKQKENAKLVLIGVGPEQEKVRNLAETLGVKDKVVFLNQRNDINEVLMAMDIFILPSLYEGLPIAGIEAQATGVPCIFSDTITNELVLSEHAKLISLNDDISKWCEIILEEYSVKINREKMNTFAKTYDIKLNAEKMMSYYENYSKIKLCHFVNGLLNGGVERFLINYFFNMNNINDYELHIVTQGKSDSKCFNEFEKLGFNIHTVTKKKESIIKNYKDIKSILKKENFDIVHCHMTTTNFFPLFYAKCVGVKVRISHSHLCNNKVNLNEKLYITLTRLVSKYRFACSKDAGRYLFGTNKNVYIINNAIDIKKFSYNEEVRKLKRAELGLNDSNIVIGHVGRFVEQKNHKFIIELITKLIKYSDKYVLVLVGTGKLEASVKQQVKKLKIEKNVYFLGNRNDVNELMQAFDIFILPSLFEGLGMVLVEAQISGMKCLTSYNTPREVKVTGNIKFIELEINKWKNEIIKMTQYERNDCSNEIASHNYEIQQEAQKLDKLYKKLLFGEKNNG